MQIPGTVSSMSSLLAQLSTHLPFPSTSTIFSAHPKCRELCNDVHTNETMDRIYRTGEATHSMISTLFGYILCAFAFRLAPCHRESSWWAPSPSTFSSSQPSNG